MIQFSEFKSSFQSILQSNIMQNNSYDYLIVGQRYKIILKISAKNHSPHYSPPHNLCIV